MRFKETVNDPIGIFEYTMRRRGRIVEVVREENLIVNGAKDALAKLLGGDGAGKTVNRIVFGTSNVAPAADDELADVAGVLTKNLTDHAYPVVGQVRFDWTLLEGEANGSVIRSFGLLCTDDTLFARKTRGGIEKQNDIELEGSWTIIF